MSVPASQRYTSTMQYVETARKIARNVLAYSTRIPKRYWQRLANPLCNHATEVYYHVQCANRIYVKTDGDYGHRKTHLQDALGNVDHVASLLDIAYDVQESPNENVYIELAEQIESDGEGHGGVERCSREGQVARGAPVYRVRQCEPLVAPVHPPE